MPSTFARNVGRYLAQLRKHAGMSQFAVRDAMGVSQQLVSAWEQGAIVPSLEQLIRLSELYGFALDDLKVAA